MFQHYSKDFEIRWADVDPNGHIRHTCYGDYATHVRFSFLTESGYTVEKFAKAGFGPVVLSEEIKYTKEVHLGERIRIAVTLNGLSPDGGRWQILHTVYKIKAGSEAASGAIAKSLPANEALEACQILMFGGWIDLKARKLIHPPQELLDIMGALEKSPGFQTLPDLRR